jgi:hypothetical protein
MKFSKPSVTPVPFAGFPPISVSAKLDARTPSMLNSVSVPPRPSSTTPVARFTLMPVVAES